MSLNYPWGIEHHDVQTGSYTFSMVQGRGFDCDPILFYLRVSIMLAEASCACYK